MWDGAWTNRRKWYESEDQYVRRQREESEQRTADAEARLRSSLSQVSAQKEALARELANLSAAFDAFVELTSVRAQLSRYVAPAEAREQARALLAELRATSADASTAAVSAGFTTVPGYWLPSAAAGLAALVRDDRHNGEAALARAAADDERRTALFLVLALSALGRSELATPWLARALGPAPSSPDDRVDLAARQVWHQAGHGGYGDFGRDVVVRWLANANGPETVSRLRVQLTRFPAGSDIAPELSARVAAGRVAVAALTQLRQLLATEPPPPASTGTRTAAAGATAGTTSRRDKPASASAPARAPMDFAESEVAPALTLLETLISEGSPADAGLLQHAEQLAAKVRQYRHIEAAAGSPHWGEPVGTVFELLEVDLREPSPDEAEVRAMAQAALRPTAGELADLLLAEASIDCPPVLALRLDGTLIEIRVDESLEPQLAEVDAGIEKRYTEPGHVSRKRAAELEVRVAEQRVRVYRDAERAVERFIEQRAQLPQIQQSAQQEHAAVLERLGRLVQPGNPA